MGLLFVLNCYYCLNGTCSRFFGQIPPTLEDYLPEGGVLNPPAVKLGDAWDYGTIHEFEEEEERDGSSSFEGEEEEW